MSKKHKLSFILLPFVLFSQALINHLFYINKCCENNKDWGRVSLDLKISRTKNSSISNYISSSHFFCFGIFGDDFCSVVCWNVVFEMQKQLFIDVLRNKFS